METGGIKKWYTKKRYILPVAFVGILLFITAILDAPAEVFPQSQLPDPSIIILPEPSGVNEVTGSDGSLINPSKALEPNESQTPPPNLTPKPIPIPRSVVPKPINKCDPNYSGCVPIASDVDCAGGTGNGPAYVNGPLHVLGSDTYELDKDGDGIACDN